MQTHDRAKTHSKENGNVAVTRLHACHERYTKLQIFREKIINKPGPHPRFAQFLFQKIIILSEIKV